MSDISKETIPGSYSIVKMPDGSEVLMTKLRDGTWATTEERIRQDEFEDRFKNTDFVPASLKQPNTATLIPKDSSPVTTHSSRNRLDAYLGEILGNPEDILAGKIRPVAIKEAGIIRHVLGMVKALNMSKWNAVRDLLMKEGYFG